jgi:hypothetical protein
MWDSASAVRPEGESCRRAGQPIRYRDQTLWTRADKQAVGQIKGLATERHQLSSLLNTAFTQKEEVSPPLFISLIQPSSLSLDVVQRSVRNKADDIVGTEDHEQQEEYACRSSEIWFLNWWTDM